MIVNGPIYRGASLFDPRFVIAVSLIPVVDNKTESPTLNLSRFLLPRWFSAAFYLSKAEAMAARTNRRLIEVLRQIL